MLTSEERERYSRHLLFSEVGESGQEKLKASSVLVVGAGGLGSPVLLYLAAAGVGHLGIIDDDVVSISNLQRQVLYKTDEIGKSKCECAAKRLQELNPDISITSYNSRLTPENSASIINEYDLVVDATDNLKTRYVISRTCCAQKKPMVYGSICENKGHTALFTCQSASTSYEALFPYTNEVESFKQPLGLVGALPGIIGTMQAMTAIKYIVGLPVLVNQLLIFDADSMDFMKLEI